MSDSTFAPVPRRPRGRRAGTLVMVAISMVMLLGMVAFALDVGYIVLVRTQLQTAADSAAVAAASVMSGDQAAAISTAQEYARQHFAADEPVEVPAGDVEFGTWDTNTRTFAPSSETGNAIRVTCRRDATNPNGECPLFFGRIFGRQTFAMTAQAIAMANPRDICFVVDLSGSMNDDTEPCWATAAINSQFSGGGYSNVGNELMTQLYEDFGYGAFPGTIQHVGQPLGVAQDQYAYAQMTKDGGPLSASSIATPYRVASSDTEAVRKQKAYKWMIDKQIAVIMPAAKPAPNSTSNYAYWEKYLDYILQPVTIQTTSGSSGGGSSGGGGGGGGGSSGGGSGGGGGGGSSSPAPPAPPRSGSLEPRRNVEWLLSGVLRSDEQFHTSPARELQVAMSPGTAAQWLIPLSLAPTAPAAGTPPNNRGTLPPSQDSDRITGFNNPNRQTFPSAGNANGWRNKIGYRTYVQFMMDHGRDLSPVNNIYTPLSTRSSFCPYHSESTAGGTFEFPPREQPTHASRRAIIAGLQVISDQNDTIPDGNQRDWVSVVTYDTLTGGGPVLLQSLTSDYEAAKQAVTEMQAVGDKSASTATEAGLIAAKKHLSPANQGGLGRKMANKVVVLLTDGVPNLYSSSNSAIDQFMGNNPSGEYYDNGAYWYDACLMQAMDMQMKHWKLFPVGLGLGTDYDFMDRMARLGMTANADGQAARGSGNPAEYEQRLIDIFEAIITNPQVRLVQ